MADHQKAKTKWTAPVLRRLEGDEADQMRAFLMERSGLLPETIKRRNAG